MSNLDDSNELLVLRDLFDSAVAAVAGDIATFKALQNFSAENVHVIAIGKAAASMMHGAIDASGARLSRALVFLNMDISTTLLKMMVAANAWNLRIPCRIVDR